MASYGHPFKHRNPPSPSRRGHRAAEEESWDAAAKGRHMWPDRALCNSVWATPNKVFSPLVLHLRNQSKPGTSHPRWHCRGSGQGSLGPHSSHLEPRSSPVPSRLAKRQTRRKLEDSSSGFSVSASVLLRFFKNPTIHSSPTGLIREFQESIL